MKQYENDTNDLLFVNEPSATYTSAVNSFDFINMAREGIFKKSLLQLMRQLSFSLQEVAKILHVSERTLQRYHENDKLATDLSEKTLLLSRLYQKGTFVFGSLDNFKDWMREPSPALNNQAPIDLLDTSFGFDVIQKELGRIEHGIFA